MKKSLIIIGSVVGIIVLIIALSMGKLAYRYFTADVKGTVDAEERISSGANRVQEYEKFFTLCTNTNNMKGNIETQEMLLEDAETAKERSRLRSNVAGMTAALRKNVSDYNNMSKQYTTERFKDSNLPAKLDVDGNTYCGN